MSIVKNTRVTRAKSNRLRHPYDWTHWFFVGLIVVSVAYVMELLALQLSAPTDGYSASAEGFSPQGFTIHNVLVERPDGLQEGDLIVSAGGKTVEEWLALAFRDPLGTSDWQAGQVVSYTIIRNGEEQVVPIKLGRLSLWMVLSRWGGLALITVTMAAIGVFVFLRKPRDQAARALLVMSLGMMTALSSNDALGIQLSEVVNRRVFLIYMLADLPGWAVLLGAILYFYLVFPTPKQFAARHSRLLLSLYLAPGLFLVLISALMGGSWAERVAAGAWLNNLLGLTFGTAVTASLGHSFYTARTATSRSQLRWIAWGTAMPFAAYVVLYALPGVVLGRPLLPTSVIALSVLFMPISFAFAIVKYRLMDIDTVINRSLVYLTLTALVSVLYFLLVTVLTGVLQLVGATAGDEGVLLLSAILIAIFFNPLHWRVQALIDRAFYRDKLNFRRLLEELSQELATTIVLSDLIPLLVEAIPRRLNITRADLMMLDRAEKRLVSASGGFTITLESELAQRLSHSVLRMADRRAMLVTPLDAAPDPLTEPLREHDVELCLPLVAGNKLIGLYAFGPKRSLEFYSGEEIGFLTTLSHQVSISLENARLHEEVAAQERLKRDLEIARQIQMDLLPQSDPEIVGLEIVGCSIPALEVGGDFYAYYHLPGGQLGVAVGDVSGKGLPGALFMAISASVLEAHAPSQDRVGLLLNVVNSTLYSRMRARRMNTALAYLLFDVTRREVQISNAGLIAPLLLRGEKAVRYLDPSSLPLGVIARRHYDESVLALQPDDVLVVVSDGIVEAMNEARELYGFERFEAVVSSYKGGFGAREILEGLLVDVQEFVGGAEQHDDITVVVVRVTGS